MNIKAMAAIFFSVDKKLLVLLLLVLFHFSAPIILVEAGPLTGAAIYAACKAACVTGSVAGTVGTGGKLFNF
jgi:hypothetical protein